MSKAETPATTQYTKEQLVRSERYRHCRDLLGALLQSGKTYTFKEVDGLLTKYMKGKVT